MAVIVWLPTAKPEVLKLAVVVPPLVLTVPWPMLVPPSEKVTTPVGVPGPLIDTVATKLTLWPEIEGLIDDVSVVLVLPLPTLCISDPVLPRKFASPALEAVTVWLPTVSVRAR